MLDVVFEEGDLLNDDDDEDEIEIEEVALSEPGEEAININEALGIERVIDLGPWVFIDNRQIYIYIYIELPVITRRFDDSDDDED